MKSRFLLLVGIYIAVITSAIFVVLTKHDSRKQFSELQRLAEQRDKLGTEWGRFKLEQTTLLSQGRVDRIAQETLNMHVPLPKEIKLIQE